MDWIKLSHIYMKVNIYPTNCFRVCEDGGSDHLVPGSVMLDL